MRIGIRDRRVFIRPRIPRDRPVATVVDVEQDEQGLRIEMRLTPHGRRVLGPMLEDSLRGISIAVNPGPPPHPFAREIRNMAQARHDRFVSIWGVTPFEDPPLEELETFQWPRLRGRFNR